jgi:hypothetical protein
MRVICVKWGDKYGPEWVTRLRNMVLRNFMVPHEFICVTESPVPGVKCLPLVCNLPHWWQKIGLVQPGLFPGWNLYLDLDVVISANIDALVSVARTDSDRLWMRDDFSYSLREPKQGLSDKQKEFLGGEGTCNSSVMLWHGDAARLAWDRFTPEVMEKQHGDQNHFTRILYPDKIGFLPDDMIGSYKYGKLRGEPIRPITVFHGEPKMNQLPPKHELRLIWESA